MHDPNLFELWQFWVSLFVALLLKYKSAPWRGKINTAITVSIGIGSAAVATVPVLDWFQLDIETYGPIVGGLIALTSEHLAQQVLKINLSDFIKLPGGNQK